MLYQSAIYLKLIWLAENGPKFLRRRGAEPPDVKEAAAASSTNYLRRFVNDPLGLILSSELYILKP